MKTVFMFVVFVTAICGSVFVMGLFFPPTTESHYCESANC